ncbi:hypothetical protein C5L14_21870 [Labrys okinawensis]|uniref:DUF1638 domain-containing protein n=2 Tax=Xanthobacteraceae TaxID=335928 RepID=A0A2S9Q8J4_9HYPH|nr:hypothetical protein C5L14_21870 [Labrys okinawensis]
MQTTKPRSTLVIACGALAREFLAVKTANGWDHVDVTCLPAIWHNYPQKIPDGIRRKIRANRARYDEILVLYGDCGTGGLLDEVLKEEGVERIDGPHCYSFFAGAEVFDRMQEEEIGTFYLTDFLVRHFDRFVIKGLKLDVHPQLLPMYFGHYKRVMFLVQVPDKALEKKAAAAAARLGLPLEIHHTGLAGIEPFLKPRDAAA